MFLVVMMLAKYYNVGNGFKCSLPYEEQLLFSNLSACSFLALTYCSARQEMNEVHWYKLYQLILSMLIYWALPWREGHSVAEQM